MLGVQILVRGLMTVPPRLRERGVGVRCGGWWKQGVGVGRIHAYDAVHTQYGDFLAGEC